MDIFENLKLRRSRAYHLPVIALLVGLGGLAMPSPVLAQATPQQPTPKPPATAQQVADYQKKLAEFKDAQLKFNAVADPYWKSILDKRKARNAKRSTGQAIVLEDYVLTQPPVYAGPDQPVDPSAVVADVVASKSLPVVADFLKSAAEQFSFTPLKPATEIDFKKAYARIASAAGLTKDQAVRIYGFEAGGNGKYDVQAGLEYDKPGAKAISTALGYNQLLTTNSVELLAEQGTQFLTALKARAAKMSGQPKADMEKKIAILQAMIDFSNTVPDDWTRHQELGATPKGWGIHALNLDVDVGPLLQTQKLMNSVNFAKTKHYAKPLTAAELEMMNLTGDGNGFDMVTMPQDFRPKVPTSNFFERGGYERNSVARKNNVVAALLSATNTKMDEEAKLQGAKDLASAF